MEAPGQHGQQRAGAGGREFQIMSAWVPGCATWSSQPLSKNLIVCVCINVWIIPEETLVITLRYGERSAARIAAPAATHRCCQLGCKRDGSLKVCASSGYGTLIVSGAPLERCEQSRFTRDCRGTPRAWIQVVVKAKDHQRYQSHHQLTKFAG